MKQKKFEFSTVKNIPKREEKPPLDKNQILLAGEIIKIANVKSKNKEYLSSFLLMSQVLENILLPHLITYLILRLGVKQNFISDETKPYALNRIYLALSHDNDLFKLLENHRTKRNQLIHKITQFKDLKKINKEAKEHLKICKHVSVEVLLRLKGTKEIPVLTLYSKGWEDFRKEVIKIIKGDEIEKEIGSFNKNTRTKA